MHFIAGQVQAAAPTMPRLSTGGGTAVYSCRIFHLLPIETSVHFSALQRVGGTRKRIAPTCKGNVWKIIT